MQFLELTEREVQELKSFFLRNDFHEKYDVLREVCKKISELQPKLTVQEREGLL
jgi:hypothetical protein